jgi:putative inorganic carbon (hco3(-)) transporter
LNSESLLLRVARWCAFGSAAAILFSIAISQNLIALSFAALLMSGSRLRLPRIWLPLALFMLATLFSMALSDSPAAGLPQVRKFYVFLELLVVYSTFDLAWTRRLLWAWAALGAASAAWACAQFADRIDEARAASLPFYDFYMADRRVTGFMSHWNTFSAQMMFVILFVIAYLLFAKGVRRWALWLPAACGLMAAAGMVLGFTRIIIFMACPAAVLYLIWWWRRWLVLVLPLAGLAAVAVSPPPVKERFVSIFRPRKNVDSNEFRRVTFRTGLEMIKAHPLLGLGPERPNDRTVFDRYVPPDIPRPLPPGWYGHLHSLYIHYAAERGIPAMLLYVWMLVWMALDFGRGARQLPPGRSDAKFILHAAAAVVIAAVLEGFFEVNLGISPVLTMFLAAAGCGYVALDGAKAVA